MPNEKFPHPYVQNAKQDDSTMVYVNGGDFAHTGIGSRASGLPKGGATPASGDKLSIEHVGKTAGGNK